MSILSFPSLSGSGVVPLDYMNPFLDEQLRALEERFKEAAKVLPSDGKLITAAEARILIGLIHVRQIASAHSEVFLFLVLFFVQSQSLILV